MNWRSVYKRTIRLQNERRFKRILLKHRKSIGILQNFRSLENDNEKSDQKATFSNHWWVFAHHRTLQLQKTSIHNFGSHWCVTASPATKMWPEIFLNPLTTTGGEGLTCFSVAIDGLSIPILLKVAFYSRRRHFLNTRCDLALALE